MKNLTYQTMDKSKFGRGPWQDEHDKEQFVDEATGLPCLIVRNQLGALCGYVGVSAEHPCFGEHYDNVDVSVHGGLTFADKCSEHGEECNSICHKVEPGENDAVWWLGFDCGHYFDLIPSMRMTGMTSDDAVYRTIDYVREQCQQLAQQLMEPPYGQVRD